MAKLTKAQVAKMSRNPGTRSKVPTSQLSAKYKKLRKSNAASAKANDPNALTAPLTPKLLGQQVSAQANLAYGQQEQSLNDAATVNTMNQQQVPSWFQQYQGALAHAESATKGAYAGALAYQQNGASSLARLDAQNNAAIGAQQQQAAATSGGSVDPATVQMAQQAAASRQQALASQSALTAGLGAANVVYRAGQQVVGAGQQVKAQLDEASRGRDIGVKKQRVAAEKGQYAATTRQKMVDAEHTKQLENKAFGLNEQKAAADVRLKTAALNETAARDKTASTDRRLALQTRQQIASADRASREHEGRLTRLTRKATAHTIATAGNISPTERRRRNTAVDKMETQRAATVSYARQVAGQLPKLKPVIDPATGKSFPANFILRRQLEKKYPGASREVIDYALAEALGSKSGVKNAGGRYRKRLQAVAGGKLAG